MSGGLQHHDEGAPRCDLCGAIAAGPCASCGRLVCGDCSAIVQGQSKVFAVCTRCEGRAGPSLRSNWIGLGLWLGGILGVLALLTVLAGLLASRR